MTGLTLAQTEALEALEKAGGSVRKAAGLLGISRSSMRDRLERIEKKCGNDSAEEDAALPEPEEPLAARQERRLLDNINRLKRERDEANRELNSREDYRESIFGLRDPIRPANYRLRPIAGKEDEAEIPVLLTSDFQWGEKIDLDEMGGLNAYNRNIAADRYRRLIESTIACCTKHHAGKPPPAFYYLRGGDAISGEIHEELADTNDLSSIPAVRDLCAHERWGIKQLADALGCPVKVISVPGNHDRTTKRPRCKGYVEHSFDSIVSWHLEMVFQDDERISFYTPPSPDALFTIHNTNFLLTHGDNMGTSGGNGYIGPVAAITKGHRKVVESYLHAGKRVDCVLSGHFHTAVETEYGFGNGCLPGLSEYASLKIRPKPAPPTQWLLHVHPVHGITTRRKLMVGGKGEGSLCDPEMEMAA